MNPYESPSINPHGIPTAKERLLALAIVLVLAAAVANGIMVIVSTVLIYPESVIVRMSTFEKVAAMCIQSAWTVLSYPLFLAADALRQKLSYEKWDRSMRGLADPGEPGERG